MKAWARVCVCVCKYNCTLSPCAIWGWMVNPTPQPLYPWEKSPSTHGTGGWMGIYILANLVSRPTLSITNLCTFLNYIKFVLNFMIQLMCYVLETD
jgi:hypothetical protein